MKIGILTFHRTHNFGGCLQAIATRTFLNKLGHDAFFVDYWPAIHKNVYSIFSFSNLKSLNWKGKIFYIIDCLVNGQYKVKRRNVFFSFIDEFISPYCKPVSETYDVIFYGSDQIWRKNSLGEYNPVFFGVNSFNASKHISFSASMGNLPNNEEDGTKLKKLLSHLNMISVREDDLKEYLYNLGYKNVTQTLDPTLLLDQSDWDCLIPPSVQCNEPYLLFYPLRGGFKEDDVREYAKKNNLKLKIISGVARKGDDNEIISDAGPKEFLELIRHAQMVITSSFHGLAFSILYKKEFVVSFSENSGRARSLLKSLNITDRFVEPYSPIPSRLENINYDLVFNRLSEMRLKTLNFISLI